ncbi:hypothetical protein GXP67_23295 [Rhodocytophaga rosea]|uniref:HAD family hydrolase n=1 Tax=Rhodocytophaga rosea TaxID=2704465 RepID=A0A6C0GMV5_9BACT|nr:hypothetical protein [Rhodocytophaga rosea]QHT69355.1 hypothetical protein GXP67_23295 [Rhodocytophaga rosea]
MRIAFDLDGTLIESAYALPLKSKWPQLVRKFCGIESLREGTLELMQYFQQQGEEVWIYTTSYRNTFYIRILFLLHGIVISGIINQTVHNRILRKNAVWPLCSKYPPAFGIDLLIDDQEGVKIESERYGFKMIWIKPEEKDWTQVIIDEYQKIKRQHV